MKCGLGNWKDVSEQYVKTKNPKQCEDHFFTFYNKSKEDYLPNDEDFIVSHKPKSSQDGIMEGKWRANEQRLEQY